MITSKSILIPFLVFLTAAVMSPYAACEEGVSLTGTEGTSDESDRSYLIGPQNLLQIKIYGEGGVNQIYRVDASGAITHALIGRIKLAGKSVAEAERIMEAKLAGDYILNPQVTIFVIEHSRFSVLGEVRRPGNYEILGRISVTEAIAMAGGFTPLANQRAVKIIRETEEGEETIAANIIGVNARAGNAEQQYLEAGDVMVVPKSFF